uniref:Wsv415-like protein n=1 Tax=Penaeus monodon majanivirus B TaxID=2984272 RepID=A0A9C7BV42_9VIRU|nr:MAG: wsv415-like protein [Penaeus monodon majanivirus B]
MSFISLKLANVLYNQRHRSLLYNHLVSLTPSNTASASTNFIINNNNNNDDDDGNNNNNNNNNNSSNNVDELIYNILAIDPLCPSDILYIKVSIIDSNITNSDFLSVLISTARCLNISKLKFIESASTPRLQSSDTKTFKLSLRSFSEIVRDHIFGLHLDRAKLMTVLFEIPQLKISTDDLVQSFFALDTFSNCILFLLYTHLFLECIGSSIRFRIEDIYTSEFINIKRKYHVSTSSDRIIRTQATHLQHQQGPFLCNQSPEDINGIDKIIKYIINPVINPPKTTISNINSNNDTKNNPLVDIIEKIRSSYPDKNHNNENIIGNILYHTISVPVNKYDNNENYILLNIRKEARVINCNKQILFPVHGRQKRILHFLNLSKEAKVLLLLPYFFSDKTTTCLMGDSILRDESCCTFVLADFLPVH